MKLSMADRRGRLFNTNDATSTLYEIVISSYWPEKKYLHFNSFSRYGPLKSSPTTVPENKQKGRFQYVNEYVFVGILRGIIRRNKNWHVNCFA